MKRRVEIIDSVLTADGLLQLVRHGDDWEITIDRRTLMSSMLNRSEIALGEMACRPLADRPAPRVLVSGLGLGYTLRAALDVLPRDAQVIVAEINPVVVDWCRSHLAPLCDNVLKDPRVRLDVGDVNISIARGAAGCKGNRYDAIVLDLYEGPYAVPAGQEDPVFGPTALAGMRVALAVGGCLAVWSEQAAPSFEKRLRSSRFDCEPHRPRHKGTRHMVYLARPTRR
jgi:spermidine synthase